MVEHSSIIHLPASTERPSEAAGATDAAVQTIFTREELTLILMVYGRYVVMGEWRDYAVAHEADRAVFSIFRRSSERPLYQITKTPALTHRQGQWTLLNMDNRILKRGHDLAMLLRVFNKKILSSVD